MSLTALVTTLRGQAASSSIELDSSVIASDTTREAIATALALGSGAHLTIAGVTAADIPDPANGKVVISVGTASLLGRTAVPIHLEFTEPLSTIEVIIRATVGTGWAFKDSFKGLDTFPFNLLTFTETAYTPPQFVYTTTPNSAYPWPDDAAHTIDLAAAGLYFLAEIGVTSFTLVGQLLGKIVKPGPVKFYGPFSPVAGQSLPVGKIRAPLGDDTDTFDVGTGSDKLTLSTPALAVQVTEAKDSTELQQVDLLVESVLDKKLDIGVVFPISGNTLALNSAPLPHASFSIPDLIETLPGGSDFEEYIPTELESVFDNVGLDSFSMVFTLSPKVQSIGLEIGTIKPWTVIKPNVLVLENMALRIAIVDPSGINLTRVLMSASAKFLPNAFKGDFAFTVSLDKQTSWEVSSVSGVYSGTVNLGDLVGELLGNQDSVPSALRAIGFSDFSLSAIRAAPADPFTYSFSGNAEVGFPLLGTEVSAQIYVGVSKPGAGNPTVNMLGGLVIGKQTFSLKLDLAKSGSLMSAEWSTSGEPLGFNGLADSLGLDLPQIPSGLDLGLKSAGVSYDFGKSSFALDAESVNFGDATFASLKVATVYQYAFQLEVGHAISLADLPLVGSKLPDAHALSISDMGLVYASKKFDGTQIGEVNQSLVPLTKAKKFSSDGLTQGFEFSATLQLAGTTIPVNVGVRTDSTKPTGGGGGGGEADALTASPADGTPAVGASAPASKGSSTTKWFNIQRQFGIFQFNRVGVGYVDGELTFSLDAGIDLGPLTFSVDGLSIGTPIDAFDPSFNIAGLGLGYNKPPLEIEGALLKIPSQQLAPDTAFQFDGMAVVKAAEFGLAAIGSYAQLKSGDPSLFVFAQLEAPLGGPPAFFITGLMAGFGFNRSLAIPGQNEVTSFPLLVLGAPPAPGVNAAAQNPTDVLDILEGRKALPDGTQKAWIAPSPGDYWLGIGIEATSFEIVQSKAVLLVSFGHELVFTLLGLSTMQLPQPVESAETYAYVELGLKAQLKPEEGFFGLSAVLSANSYVLTPDCHLTGGFAFYLWFGDNPHSGQFVVTLGGYHPAFKPPSFYPTEPRLGFNWAVSSSVSITGGAYFALTPSCVMAGGSLDAQYHDGNLRAWFKAYADVLISWRPFFFTADIGVSIGVSYRLNLLFCHKTISVSLSASVDLWGPPTGGKVHVHIVVVSFTVHFGSDGIAGANDPLGWTDFKSLLPHPNNVCKITVSDGMYKTLASTVSSNKKLWVVRARSFKFFTQAAVPSSKLAYPHSTDPGTTDFDGDPVDISPMNKTGVDSTHSLSIYPKGGSKASPIDVSKWSLEKRHGNVPKSLWGKPPSPFTQIPATPTADVIDGSLVGYEVSAPSPEIGPSLGLVKLTDVGQEHIAPEGQAPIDASVQPSTAFVPAADASSIGKIADIQSTASSARDSLFGVLDGAGLYKGPNESLEALGQDAEHLFSDAPMVQTPRRSA
ncbi:MAG: DUF6603 domain-containing protein [Myxococcota bacterium]